MRKARKMNKTAKAFLGIFSVVILLMLFGIGALAISTISERPDDIMISAGTVVYNNTNTPIELLSEGVLSQEVSSSQYYLTTTDGGTIPLGSNTIAYSGSGVSVFGGGYYIDSDGMVEAVADENVYSDYDNSTIIKLADRKYVIIGAEITDEDDVFVAEHYLYIILDVVGNAYLLSENVCLKTTSPTTIYSGDLVFNIAEEELDISGQVIDMQTILGSTNTYDSAINKELDDEQTPDVIDVVIEAGDGGDGGSGGSGGDGGDGGNGGDGGDGGDGSDGGDAGDGGTGGSGGSGGSGGTAGVGEETDVVSILLLNSVTSNTSDSLTADFSFVDPYGTLGLVYLELHDAEDLEAYGITVDDLFDSETELATEVADYKAYFDEFCSANRASIQLYDDDYTFTSLEANTSYYVILAHDYELDDGSIVNELVDYFKVKTIEQENVLKIDSMTSTQVKGTFSIENVSLCSGGTYELCLVFSDGTKTTYELQDDDIIQASKSSFTFTFTITGDVEDEFLASKVLQVGLYLQNDSTAILTTSTSNSFYKAN